MIDVVDVAGVLVVIAATMVYIYQNVFKATVIAESFTKYASSSYAAFSWVEKVVPDSYGQDEADPAYAKMIHKMDMFLKKFNELSLKYTGSNPSQVMVDEAMALAATLAADKSSTAKQAINIAAAVSAALDNSSKPGPESGPVSGALSESASSVAN